MRLDEASRWPSGQTVRDRSDRLITNTVLSQAGTRSPLLSYLLAILIADIRLHEFLVHSPTLYQRRVKRESSGPNVIVNAGFGRTN
jgi:hypothetical protein